MSKLNDFPDWELTLLPEPVPQAEAEAKARRKGFAWPTPPFAAYPGPTEQTDPLACTVTGRNGNSSHCRLTFFVPEESLVHLQQPPARTTFPLRFNRFQSLVLSTTLAPLEPAGADTSAQVLGHAEPSPYVITLAAGGQLTGQTIGHVQTDYGLFLFPPSGSEGAVQRMFVPRAAYSHAELGQRIGELLVEQNKATPEQVEQAVTRQTELRRQKIGDILVQREVVSPEQLLEALDRQAKMPMVRIGEALLSMGMIDQQQLEQALVQQREDRSVPLGELLVQMGAVTREDLQEALSRKMGYPLVDLEAFPVEADACRKLSYAVASRLRVMPLLVRDGRLVLAIDNPSRRRDTVEEAEFICGIKVVPVLGKCRHLDTLLLSAYEKFGIDTGRGSIHFSTTGLPPSPEPADTGKLVETLEREEHEPLSLDVADNIEQSDNSLVRLINNMIIEAHKDGASDIHIESYPGREKIRIRFRKDGVMHHYLELPPGYRNAMIARIKIMCDLDISEKRKPQDGKIAFAKFSPQHRIELRVATIPTNSGLEDVVMRILASAKPVPLDDLGMSDENLRRLKGAIERPYGMVLCVGPTGSGKTTTLHSALSYINVPERKIWTAEDPIEITQPGLRQVQVNAKIDWTFAKALRAFLRADPDAIMVGEVRDKETAQMAIEASLTGHLVLSTLHTNSAPETVTRLLDMGMDPFNFADSLLVVLAQRLVRRLCKKCRVSEPADDARIDELLNDYMYAFGEGEPPVQRDDVLAGWKQRHSRDGRLLAHRSTGCEACDGSGLRGRAGLHELMLMSRELRHLVQTGARAEALQKVAMAEGMRTLRQDGIDKVLAGITTIEEVRATSNS